MASLYDDRDNRQDRENSRAKNARYGLYESMSKPTYNPVAFAQRYVRDAKKAPNA